MRLLVALTLAVGAAACAPPPPPVVTPVAPPKPSLTLQQKQATILKLEDQRVLRDPDAAPLAVAAPTGEGSATPAGSSTIPEPTLLDLVTDGDARIRRRAALAIGRVGLADAVPSLVARLTDDQPEVRQMAAFALGLLRDPRAREPLVAALSDPAAMVQASAAEALGSLGESSAADPIASLAKRILDSGALASLPSEERSDVRETPADAFRLALTALVRLKAFPALASVVLDVNGQPRLTWWPVAFALGRLEDPGAATALLTLAADPQPYTRTFAIKGLGALKEVRAVPLLLPLVSGTDRAAAIEAIRALGKIGDKRGSAVLVKAVQTSAADASTRIEAVTALGTVGGDGVNDLLLDLIADRSPLVRGAAIRAFAHLDPDAFIAILSGLEPDPDWAVRAALASALGEMPDAAGLPRLKTMLQDSDQRVLPSVLAALARVNAPNVSSELLAHLNADDPVVRAAAANAVAELKIANGPAALRDAYRYGDRDVTYVARGAALSALATYGASEAVPLLTDALKDKDWAVRMRAYELLRTLNASSTPDASDRMRPAPEAHGLERYDAAPLVAPQFSTQADLETDKGTIQIELAVLDAPLTVANFVALARSGFYDGVNFHRVVADFVVQTGDPRGDGEGGPGFTIRDELNERSYLRGTVGMALDWADTGGSQFFITHSPQPHLDGRYTAFGQVIAGMDVVDRLQPGDVLRRVRIRDGTEH